jgi:hypothetical protein
VEPAHLLQLLLGIGAPSKLVPNSGWRAVLSQEGKTAG